MYILNCAKFTTRRLNILANSRGGVPKDKINELRKKYDDFLEEDKKRKNRNEEILGRLEKMRSCVSTVQHYNKIEPRTVIKYTPKIEYLNHMHAPVYNDIHNKDVLQKNILLDDCLLLKKISQKYILIPKTNSLHQHLIPANLDYDEDWKTKYNILEKLKKEQIGEQAENEMIPTKLNENIGISCANTIKEEENLTGTKNISSQLSKKQLEEPKTTNNLHNTDIKATKIDEIKDFEKINQEIVENICMISDNYNVPNEQPNYNQYQEEPMKNLESSQQIYNVETEFTAQIYNVENNFNEKNHIGDKTPAETIYENTNLNVNKPNQIIGEKFCDDNNHKEEEKNYTQAVYGNTISDFNENQVIEGQYECNQNNLENEQNYTQSIYDNTNINYEINDVHNENDQSEIQQHQYFEGNEAELEQNADIDEPFHTFMSEEHVETGEQNTINNETYEHTLKSNDYDKSQINDFETEQTEMFYTKETDKIFENMETNDQTLNYTTDNNYADMQYPAYEVAQQQMYSTEDIKEPQETTEMYDQSYDEQFGNRDIQNQIGYETSQEVYDQNLVTTDYAEQHHEYMHNEAETVEDVENRLDVEEGYADHQGTIVVKDNLEENVLKMSSDDNLVPDAEVH